MGELLSAALDRARLRVTYDSIESGITERVIPYDLYASQGYWYCACFDRGRETNVPMRADRFLAAERVEGFEPLPELSIQGWMGAARGVGERVRVRARVPSGGGRASSLHPSLAASKPKRVAEPPRSPGRINIQRNEGYAHIMLRGSTTVKIAASMKIRKDRRVVTAMVNIRQLPFVIPGSMPPTGEESDE